MNDNIFCKQCKQSHNRIEQINQLQEKNQFKCIEDKGHPNVSKLLDLFELIFEKAAPIQNYEQQNEINYNHHYQNQLTNQIDKSNSIDQNHIKLKSDNNQNNQIYFQSSNPNLLNQNISNQFNQSQFKKELKKSLDDLNINSLEQFIINNIIEQELNNKNNVLNKNTIKTFKKFNEFIKSNEYQSELQVKSINLLQDVNTRIGDRESLIRKGYLTNMKLNSKGGGVIDYNE